MSSKYWLDYVRSCYDLVIEGEGITSINLAHEVEAYVVHLMAKNFERSTKQSQRDVDETVKIVNKDMNKLERDTATELRSIRAEVDNKIKKALDNPLAGK